MISISAETTASATVTSMREKPRHRLPLDERSVLMKRIVQWHLVTVGLDADDVVALREAIGGNGPVVRRRRDEIGRIGGAHAGLRDRLVAHVQPRPSVVAAVDRG